MSTATKLKTQAVELPEPGVWEFDAAHSSVGAVARHLMLAKVRGRFGGFTGSVTIGETLGDTSVQASIDAASIDTANQMRDDHLRSPDFLDVERYPTLEFRSTSVEQTGEDTLRLDGELTIRGITRPVSLDVAYQGLTAGMGGEPRAVFSAETELDREDWGMTWNQALESGGVLVGKRLKVQLEITAVRTS